jgi:leucyl/phenylalanyl-tRNA---protein transferase
LSTALTTSIGWAVSSSIRRDGGKVLFRLTPEILLAAYAGGVFPMAESADDPELFWVDPRRRGILPLDAFHVPRRLRRVVRHGGFEITCDTAFEDVMFGCGEATEKRPNTWINGEIVRLYAALFARGAAHSVEAWREGSLAGGLYGVSLGAAFFGESMFSRVTDASKVALVHLAARLRLGGYRLLDTQFLTPHLARFGGIEISRARYHRLLAEALSYRTSFPAVLPEALRGDPLAALQSSRTTS